MGRWRAQRGARRRARRVGGSTSVRDRRDLLLPALHAVQDRVGWISRGALNYICRRLSRAARRSLGRRHLLSPVSTPSPRRPSSRTSATTSRAG